MFEGMNITPTMVEDKNKVTVDFSKSKIYAYTESYNEGLMRFHSGTGGRGLQSVQFTTDCGCYGDMGCSYDTLTYLAANCEKVRRYKLVGVILEEAPLSPERQREMGAEDNG